MFPVSSQSTNTNLAPRWNAGPTVAMNVSVGAMTVHELSTQSSAITRSIAAVPLETATA